MKVEIFSDIACPWCYIGRRRFDSALDQFEHRDNVEVVWRSFQLDPNAPRQYDGSVYDLLARKYGMSYEQSEAMHDKITALAAQEGLDYHFELAHPVNSFDAHRLIHLAAHYHLQGEMKERLQRAYFTEGALMTDIDTLVRLAVEIGLDADETREILQSDAYAVDVRADVRRARALGINGVPFFLFNEKYAVSGAQPVELFLTALDRTWEAFPEVVQLAGADQEAGLCDDESCTI